jgi:hypothetical protein
MSAGASPFLREIDESSRAARRKAGRLAWNLGIVADAERLGAVSPRGARRMERALDNRLLRPLAFAAIWAFVALTRAKRRREVRRVECELTTVSQAMRDHDVDRIDLLKVDAEGAEWPVLQGIEETDWPRIRQLVLEVHGEELAKRICALLEEKGYEVHVDNDGWRVPELMGFKLVYARR